jgi:NAD(P)-dependent dehydrogenase (short-subunit alcohol dehydrogenase family)
VTGEFAGKVAMVTGAASGIGSVIGVRFGEAGARTVVADVVGRRRRPQGDRRAVLCVDGGYSAGKLAVQGPHVATHPLEE